MSRRSSAFLPVAAIVALGLVAPAARASLARALELSELTSSADRIVIAAVVSVASSWDAAHRNIHTAVELAVQESWKGEIPGSGRFTLHQLGGTVGEIEMSVLGAARFVPGERALLFLKGHRLAGMAQGKRAVRWEAAGRRWLVEPPDQAGATLLDSRGARAPLPAAEALDDLRSRVTRLLGR